MSSFTEQGCDWRAMWWASLNCSMLLQSSIAEEKDNVRTSFVHPSLWVGCGFPFLWELAVAGLLGNFISGMSVVAAWWLLCSRKAMQLCPLFQQIWRETAASRDGKIRRVRPCIIQSSSEQHSQTSITLTHPTRVLIPQDASDRMMPCTMFGGPWVPGRSVVSANNLDCEVKRHGKFEQRQGSLRSSRHLKINECLRCCTCVLGCDTSLCLCKKNWSQVDEVDRKNGFSPSGSGFWCLSWSGSLVSFKAESTKLIKFSRILRIPCISFDRVADSSVGLNNPYCGLFRSCSRLRILACHYFKPHVTTPLFPPPEDQRLRRVPEWGICSANMLDSFGQASICLPANSSIIFALSEFEEAHWKAFQEKTKSPFHRLSPLCMPKVLRPSKTSFAWLTWH